MADTRITIRLSDEDDAWIKAQSDALGLDNAAAVVRMLIRQARIGNVSLSVVMQGVGKTREMPAVRELPAHYYEDRPNPLISVRPSVGDAYAEDAAPIDESVVDDMLASRLEELASAPIPLHTNGHADTAPIAISLRPAPKRQGRDYR